MQKVRIPFLVPRIPGSHWSLCWASCWAPGVSQFVPLPIGAASGCCCPCWVCQAKVALLKFSGRLPGAGLLLLCSLRLLCLLCCSSLFILGFASFTWFSCGYLLPGLAALAAVCGCGRSVCLLVGIALLPSVLKRAYRPYYIAPRPMSLNS